jgi:hypothetical protein
MGRSTEYWPLDANLFRLPALITKRITEQGISEMHYFDYTVYYLMSRDILTKYFEGHERRNKRDERDWSR